MRCVLYEVISYQSYFPDFFSIDFHFFRALYIILKYEKKDEFSISLVIDLKSCFKPEIKDLIRH